VVTVGEAEYHQSLHLLPDQGRVRIYGRDITARTRAEKLIQDASAKLREADVHKNEFLAMLSHELRNPLAPIRNSLHILDRSAPGSAAAGRAHAVIDRQVTHLTRLVDDLLDIARISRGKIQLQRQTVDLCDIVRQTCDDVRPLLAEAGLGFEVGLPDQGICVNGDGTRLAQVASNLLRNAVKFTDRGGQVRVSLAREGGSAVLRVGDTGMGVTPDMLPRLFEPFTQADRTLARSHGGLGLGLSVVKGLVALHGGEVSAHSEGLGRGTEFVVRLPVAPAASPRASASASQPAPRPRRVLVIEDNTDAATSLCEVLEIDGHQAVVAFSGPEGLAQAHAFRPEVVLCDIGLPGMDGYAIARAMRADPVLKTVYLVALTGYALPEDIRRAHQAGFDRHLAKPPSLEELQQLLGREFAVDR
jgi:two-component system CheB/CheR fusion protein